MNADMKFDYHSAISKANFDQSRIDSLRTAVIDYQIIPHTLSNKQLLLFLSRCDGDVKAALELLVKHYEIKRKAPQLFRARDVQSVELQQTLENQYFIVLPPKRGYIVCYYALQNSQAKNFNYNASTKCFLMMIETALSIYGPSNGLILVYDMKNFRLGHLTRNNLRSMKSFFAYMQEGVALRLEEIHIFNTFSSFNLVMKIISPLMRAELMEKMHLHSSSIDLEKFHTNHVPKQCLPSDSDYGGECESVEVLHRKNYHELLEIREYFLAEEKQLFSDI